MDVLSSISFLFCPDTEADRIIYTSRCIADGFYKDKGFLVLPEAQGLINPNIVILPQLNYWNYPDYWKYVSDLALSIPTNPPAPLKQFILTQLKNHKTRDLDEVAKRFKDQWKVKESLFWKEFNSIFLGEKMGLKSVEVRITNFGTISSFNDYDPQIGKFSCYIRKDRGISELPSMIILSVLKNKYSDTLSWDERMAIKEFLMTNTKLAKIFPAHKPVYPNLNKYDPKLKNISTKYLKKLKVIYKHKPINIVENEIYIKGSKTKTIFTKKDKRILKELTNSNSVVSFDSIADLIWKGDDQNYSLWAINKAMQRLRNKLAKEGLPKDCLKTIRKQGYLLQV